MPSISLMKSNEAGTAGAPSASWRFSFSFASDDRNLYEGRRFKWKKILFVLEEDNALARDLDRHLLEFSAASAIATGSRSAGDFQ